MKQVDFAIVPDKVHLDNGTCPHCDTPAHPILMQSIGQRNGSIIGDMLQCTECTLCYFVVEYPVIRVNKPIFTLWTVYEAIAASTPN